MQTAHHVNFRDSMTQGVLDHCHYFLDRLFERVGIALLGGESTELTGKNADVRIIDVTVMNIRRVITVFLLSNRRGHNAQRVQIG